VLPALQLALVVTKPCHFTTRADGQSLLICALFPYGALLASFRELLLRHSDSDERKAFPFPRIIDRPMELRWLHKLENFEIHELLQYLLGILVPDVVPKRAVEQEGGLIGGGVGGQLEEDGIHIRIEVALLRMDEDIERVDMCAVCEVEVLDDIESEAKWERVGERLERRWRTSFERGDA